MIITKPNYQKRIDILNQVLDSGLSKDEQKKAVNAVAGLLFEKDTLRSEVLKYFIDEMMDLFSALKKEKESFGEMGIDFKEKAFYDILKALAVKYDFEYPEDKLRILSKEVKKVVDDKIKHRFSRPV